MPSTQPREGACTSMSYYDSEKENTDQCIRIMSLSDDALCIAFPVSPRQRSFPNFMMPAKAETLDPLPGSGERQLIPPPQHADSDENDSDSGIDVCSDCSDDTAKPSVITEIAEDDVRDRELQNQQALNTIRNLFPTLPSSWADDEEDDESYYTATSSATVTPTATPIPLIIVTNSEGSEENQASTGQDKNGNDSDKSDSGAEEDDEEESTQLEHLETAVTMESARLYESGLCMCNACRGEPFYKLEDFRSDLEGKLDLSYMGRHISMQRVFTSEQIDEFERRVSAVKDVVLELEPHNYNILEDLDHWLACKEVETTVVPLSAHSNICLTSRSYHPPYEYGRTLSAQRFNPYGNAPKKFNEMTSTFFRKNLISGKRDAQWWYLYYMPSHFKMVGHSDLPTILEDAVLLNLSPRPNISPEAQSVENHHFLIHDHQLAAVGYFDNVSDTSSSVSSPSSETGEQDDDAISEHSAISSSFDDYKPEPSSPRMALDMDRVSELSDWYKGQRRTWDVLQDDINLLVSRWEPEPVAKSRRPSPRPPARSFPTYASSSSDDASAEQSEANTPKEELTDTPLASSRATSSLSSPRILERNISPPEIQISAFTTKPLMDLKEGERIYVKERRSGVEKAFKNFKKLFQRRKAAMKQ
ncbi:hypothetical protein BJ508DRAFT_308673 [Ascobolus immersus RN42]|uniref:Uncharacterized protein n=1 Tax=Ascobolus immersus RN42 TaxID=1160509 RepID=A0A3N4I342_ASCIM|nr:hypothetical protein BJ508DRAFT_308673 [Ascobolus immersus RN42]